MRWIDIHWNLIGMRVAGFNEFHFKKHESMVHGLCNKCNDRDSVEFHY